MAKVARAHATHRDLIPSCMPAHGHVPRPRVRRVRRVCPEPVLLLPKCLCWPRGPQAQMVLTMGLLEFCSENTKPHYMSGGTPGKV